MSNNSVLIYSFFNFNYSLTIADSILILDTLWQKSVVQHFMKPPEWYNKTYPYVWHPIKGISLSATIFMVVAVSAERFRAVCHPFSRHHVSINYHSVKLVPWNLKNTLGATTIRNHHHFCYFSPLASFWFSWLPYLSSLRFQDSCNLSSIAMATITK